MKFQLLIFTALFFCNTFFTRAQCVVDAGNNIHLCPGDSPVKINASIIQGKSPFTFLWSIDSTGYPYYFSPLKDMLNDSTILNPNLNSVYPKNADVYLRLTVRDSNGAICSDSIRVSESEFAHDMDATPKWLWYEGDSITLCAPLHAGGGFKPWRNYKWTPAEFISGSDSGICISTRSILRKDCDTVGYGIYGPYIGIGFSYTAQDARGCTVKDGSAVAFYQGDGMNEISNSSQISVYPNPSNNTINISLMNGEEIKEIILTDIAGKTVLSGKIQAISYMIEKGNLSPGIFLLTLKSKSDHTFKTKILFE